MAEGDTLTATVNARVPRAQWEQIQKEVKQRRRAGVWASVADVIRDALTDYLSNRGKLPEQCNGHGTH